MLAGDTNWISIYPRINRQDHLNVYITVLLNSFFHNTESLWFKLKSTTYKFTVTNNLIGNKLAVC